MSSNGNIPIYGQPIGNIPIYNSFAENNLNRATPHECFPTPAEALPPDTNNDPQENVNQRENNNPFADMESLYAVASDNNNGNDEQTAVNILNLMRQFNAPIYTRIYRLPPNQNTRNDGTQVVYSRSNPPNISNTFRPIDGIRFVNSRVNKINRQLKNLMQSFVAISTWVDADTLNCQITEEAETLRDSLCQLHDNVSEIIDQLNGHLPQ